MVALPVPPDYPSTTKWLIEKEKPIADKRLIDYAGISDDDGPDQSVFHGLKLAVMDPKVWFFAYHATIMGLSLSYFFPIITAALGYSTVTNLLLTAPPWV